MKKKYESNYLKITIYKKAYVSNTNTFFFNKILSSKIFSKGTREKTLSGKLTYFYFYMYSLVKVMLKLFGMKASRSLRRLIINIMKRIYLEVIVSNINL